MNPCQGTTLRKGHTTRSPATVAGGSGRVSWRWMTRANSAPAWRLRRRSLRPATLRCPKWEIRLCQSPWNQQGKRRGGRWRAKRHRRRAASSRCLSVRIHSREDGSVKAHTPYHVSDSLRREEFRSRQLPPGRIPVPTASAGKNSGPDSLRREEFRSRQPPSGRIPVPTASVGDHCAG